MSERRCRVCDDILIVTNSVRAEAGKICRTCLNTEARNYRQTWTLKQKERYAKKKNETDTAKRRSQGILPAKRLSMKEKERRRKAKEEWHRKREENRIQKERRNLVTPFLKNVFQPRICIDCSEEFWTLHPKEWVSLYSGFSLGRGTERCEDCRRKWRHSHHGKVVKKCQFYGVPFLEFNYSLIFERDKWICQNPECGIQMSPAKRGSYDDDAPELDHIWAIALVYDGLRSPGHIPLNCQTLCRKCNRNKRDRVDILGINLIGQHPEVAVFDEPGICPIWYLDKWKEFITKNPHHKSFEIKRLVVKRPEKTYTITCASCGKEAVKKSHKAEYCSDKCQEREYKRRQRNSKKARKQRRDYKVAA